jgi:hypothetical protein
MKSQFLCLLIFLFRASAGVLILSEFSGSSHLLSGAITVNPWELDQLIDALRDATFMSIKEKEHRRDCDFLFVSSNPPRRWAKCVLSDIVNAKKKEDEFVYMGTGFGLDFRVMEVSAHFRVSFCCLFFIFAVVVVSNIYCLILWIETYRTRTCRSISSK